MATTIQVEKETLELLKHMRKTSHTASYNELIHSLIKKSNVHPPSLYGFLGKKKMKDVLTGLRDKNDRI